MAKFAYGSVLFSGPDRWQVPDGSASGMTDGGIAALLSEKTKQSADYLNRSRQLDREIANLNGELLARRSAKIEREFVLSSEHITLISKMHFIGMWQGDLVSIGVDGKRPFGSSMNLPEHVAEILGWEFDSDDDLPEPLVQRATRLLDELPLAVNQIVAEGIKFYG